MLCKNCKDGHHYACGLENCDCDCDEAEPLEESWDDWDESSEFEWGDDDYEDEDDGI